MNKLLAQVLAIGIFVGGAIACFVIGHPVPACWLLFFAFLALCS